MADPVYYRIALDKYSKLNYKCYSKHYFGTLEDIRIFSNTIRNRPDPEPGFEEIALTIPYAYLKTVRGEWDPEQDGKLPFTRVKLLHKEIAEYNSRQWSKLCTWQWSSRWDFAWAFRTCCWFREGTNRYKYYRASKVQFYGLTDRGRPTLWPQNAEMFWGFPKVIKLVPAVLEHQLMAGETTFRNLRSTQADWEAFSEYPEHTLFNPDCDYPYPYPVYYTDEELYGKCR